MLALGLPLWACRDYVTGKAGGLDATATRLMWAFADEPSRRRIILECVWVCGFACLHGWLHNANNRCAST